MEEEEQLLLTSPSHKASDKGYQGNKELQIVRIPSTGYRQVYGISSSYSIEYPIALEGIVSRDEFIDIISRLNDTIRSYWPCNMCYFFGYGCSICTCGASLLCPNYCMSHSEKYAVEMLKQVSLKSKYWEKGITFTISNQFCNSFVEVKFPRDTVPATSPLTETMEEGSAITKSWTVMKQPSTRLKDL